MRFISIRKVVLSLLVCVAAAPLISCQPRKWHGDQKLVILGIDGMDPQLLKKFMAEGKMPNFSALVRKGSFRLLTTSIPPQSPVAWSNLITGMNAGGHGIFDFIHRDPKTLLPYFSASRVVPPKLETSTTFRTAEAEVPLGNRGLETKTCTLMVAGFATGTDPGTRLLL